MSRASATAALGLICGIFATVGIGTVRASEVIQISRADCRYLVRHQPAPDVAYEPGVDAYGQPVVPADLDGGNSLDLPDTIVIDVTALLAGQFNIPEDSPVFKQEARIGIAEVRNGEVYFNGRPLGSAETRALTAACRDQTGAPDP